MSDRLFTLLCALGALFLFLAMFVRGGSGFDQGRDVPRPTSVERRGNGYYAAASWLRSEGVRVESLRERFDALLAREDLPPTGNLLIVTLPATTSFGTEEFLPLDRWIRRGNTLFVLAALSDNPDWAFALGGLAPGDLNLLTGLEFETVRMREHRLQTARSRDGRRPSVPPGDPAERTQPQPGAPVSAAFAEPRHSALAANRSHAYFVGVREAIALSDYPQQPWTVKVPYEGFVLSLARQRETGEGVLWTRPLGEGRIVVSGFGSLFTNRALGLGDNAQLLANIVSVNVSPEGAVLFDDVHQGLGAVYDPAQFYRDPRLHATIGILIALWLAWVLGSTRLRAPVRRLPAPRDADLVRAAGELLARVLRPDAAARRLFEHFFQRVRARTGTRSAGPPWELFERHPRIAPADLERLRAWYADAHAARRVPLRRLHNLIVRVESRFA